MPGGAQPASEGPADDAWHQPLPTQPRAGNDLGARLGTGKWELPYPSTVVVGQDGTVRFADIHPNWMIRTEAATVIDVVQRITNQAIA